MNWQQAERIVRSKNILMSVSSKNLNFERTKSVNISYQLFSRTGRSGCEFGRCSCWNCTVVVGRSVHHVRWTLCCLHWTVSCYKYFIAFNTHLLIKIFSPYFVDLLVLMGIALSTILLISSGETSPNRNIFFTDDAAKKFFPTSKISAQESRHQFFLIWSNLTIMAHIMGLGNQSKSWKIIILS